MKTIIAGSRGINDYNLLLSTLDKASQAGFPITEVTEVVYGGASGVDALGKRWAMERGIPMTFSLPTGRSMERQPVLFATKKWQNMLML